LHKGDDDNDDDDDNNNNNNNMKNVRTWPWNSKISGSLTKYLHIPYSSQLQEWSSHFPKNLDNIDLTKNVLRVGLKTLLLQRII